MTSIEFNQQQQVYNEIWMRQQSELTLPGRQRQVCLKICTAVEKKQLLDKLNDTFVRLHYSLIENNRKQKSLWYIFPNLYRVLRFTLMGTSFSPVSNDSNSAVSDTVGSTIVVSSPLLSVFSASSPAGSCRYFQTSLHLHSPAWTELARHQNTVFWHFPTSARYFQHSVSVLRQVAITPDTKEK